MANSNNNAGEQETKSILDDIDLDGMGVTTPFSSESGNTSLGKEDPDNKGGEDDAEDDVSKTTLDDDPDNAANLEDDKDKGGDTDDDPAGGDDDSKETAKDDKTDDDPSDPPGDDDATSSLAQDLIQVFGFDDINPEDYADDTIDSVRSLTEEMGKRMAKQELDSMFEQYPDAKEYIDYLQAGGDPNRFHSTRQQAIDYENFTLDEKDEASQETLVRQVLELNKYDKEDIDSMVGKYRDTGILKDQAEIALKNLKKYSAAEKEQVKAETAQLREEQAKQVQEHWDTVRKTLKSNASIRDVPIPVKEHEALMDFISKPADEHGYSQRDKKVLEMSLEDRILIDYLIMKDFPFEKLIDKKAATKHAEGLRQRVRSGSAPSTGRKKPNTGSSKGDLPDTVSEAIEGLDLS